MRSIRRVFPLLLGTVLTAGACGARGGPSEPAPELTECPLPQVWTVGGRRPVGLRVENESQDSVVIFLRECKGTVRVADVRPGQTRVFPLPDRLLAFPGGLRFHTIRHEPDSGLLDHQTVTVPLDTAKIVAIRIPARRVECPVEVYVNGERHHGPLPPLDPARLAGVVWIYPEDPEAPSGSVCPSLHIRLHPEKTVS